MLRLVLSVLEAAGRDRLKGPTPRFRGPGDGPSVLAGHVNQSPSRPLENRKEGTKEHSTGPTLSPCTGNQPQETKAETQRDVPGPAWSAEASW